MSQGIRTWIRIVFALSVGAQAGLAYAQIAPARPVAATGAEFDLLRDVMASQWRFYKGPDDRLCLDPIVAAYRASPSAPRERWSTDVLSRIASEVRVSLDTLTTDLTGNVPGCTRSQGTWRVAYGRPRIHPDSAAMVFISTRLDARGQVDSFKLDFRIDRKEGKWHVDGWLADTATVHTYVRGDGCYRLTYTPFEFMRAGRPAIDTMDIAAETTFVGASWRSVPAYRLSMRRSSNAAIAQRWPPSAWHVTHDSIHLEWGGAWEQLYADLQVAGDSLRGLLRFETDAIVPNPPTTPVGGRRVPCG